MNEEAYTTRPSGILEPAERELLTDVDKPDNERDKLLENLRERMYHALLDIELLYLTLRSEDIEAVFAPEDDSKLSEVRVSCQYALALLFLGMETNGDMTGTRITDALSYAGASRDCELTADIDIIRAPMAPVEHRLQRLKEGGLEGLYDAGIETLFYDPDIDPECLSEAFTAAGIAVTVEEIRSKQAFNALERIPHVVITNVEVQDTDASSAERN